MPLNGGARKTVLVVEDDADILNLVRIVLQEGGLEVLWASSAAEAMAIESEFMRPIHLLLSGVVMPGIIGPELAATLKKRRPDMRVILMSGYPDGALLVLNYGWHFIQKPFVAELLLAKVNGVLVSATPEQGTDHFDTRQ
jgi:two-component system cell cycle sensor histidine kinase/response regulator CckA